MSVVLEVKNLKTHFIHKKQVIPAVDGIDLTIPKGEIVALVGESGSGKSMTSLSIMRLLPSPERIVVQGEVYLNGRNLLALEEKQMRRVRGNEMAMIFQEPLNSLNPVLTIGSQISEVIRYHRKLSKQEALQTTIQWLERVGFSRAAELIHEYPHTLSGGMRQRVLIAMAMSCQPQLLLADEPTTALDVTIQAQILDLMKHITGTFATSILLITHDLGVVSEVADRVVVMYAGQAVESAPVEELFAKPAHPYTQGLLASTPSMEEESKRLPVIKGNVPPADHMPNGCRFAPRCPQAVERCHQEMPELREVGPGHDVRCLLYAEGGSP